MGLAEQILGQCRAFPKGTEEMVGMGPGGYGNWVHSDDNFHSDNINKGETLTFRLVSHTKSLSSTEHWIPDSFVNFPDD